MKLPRTLAAGLLLAGIALLSTACGPIARPEGWASPTTAGDITYVFTDDDELSALRLSDQGAATVLWRFPNDQLADQKDIKLDGVYGEPILDGDTLYFADYSGVVFALNAADGRTRERWPFDEIDGSIVEGPTMQGDFLAFGTTEGRLYLIDKRTAAPAAGWPEKGVKVGAPVWAPPVFSGENVYVATMKGKVFGYRVSDASELWDEPFEVPGAIADLALVGGKYLFVPSTNRSVNFVDIVDGRPIKNGFKASDWVWTQPAFKDGVAYFGDFGGKVYAVNITSLEEKWPAYDAGSKVKAGPVIVGNRLVVADRSPAVHFLNLDNGQFLNRVPIADAGTVRAPVAIRADKALVLTTKGRLFLADPEQTSVNQIQIGTGQ